MESVQYLNIILTVLLVLATSIYTFLTYRILKSYKDPIIYLKTKLIDTPLKWDKSLMIDLDPIAIDIEGLSRIDVDKKVICNVFNKGNTSATELILEYQIITYKNEFEFGIDKADVKSVKPVIHKIANRKREINYLTPGSKYEFELLFTSNYPRIEIVVNKFKSKEVKIITKNLMVFEYNNSDHIICGDSDDYRQMIGVKY